MTSGHIYTHYTSVSHGIVPGSHCMMFPNGRIIKFGHVSSRIHTRNIGLHVFIDNYTTTKLNRSISKNFLGIQRDPKANTNNICLDLSSLLCPDITWNTILGYDWLDFVSMYDIDPKLFSDVIDNFTTLRIERATQPVRASHQPGRIELTYCKAITQFVRNKTSPIGQSCTRFEHTSYDSFGIIKCHKVINMPGAFHSWYS